VVEIEDRDGEFVIRRRSPAYQEARGMLSGGPSLTADPLAERAEEKERERAREARYLSQLK